MSESGGRSEQASFHWGRELAALGGGYLGLALLSQLISRQPGSIATLWYANAWALAWLVAHPRSPQQLRFGLALTALANWLANMAWGDSPWRAAQFLPGNLLEILVGWWALRHTTYAGLLRQGYRGLLMLLARGVLWPSAVGASVGLALMGWNDLRAEADLWISWFEGALLGSMVMLPLALGLHWRSREECWRLLWSLDHAALQCLTISVTWLAVALLPMPFAYLAVPLLAAAALAEFLVLSAVVFSATLSVQVALAVGVFVPPPITTRWEEIFIYLPLVMTLLPVQLLGAVFGSLRRGEAALRESVDRLAAAKEGMEQFVKVASHDLREPLSSISGLMTLLETEHGEQLPAPARHYLALAQRASVQSRQLLDDMLAYVRLGRDVAQPSQPVDLSKLLAQTLELLADSVKATGASVISQPLPTVPGHPLMLGLMLQHLLSNALKFVPPGRAPKVEICAERRANRVQLRVRDHGIGIAPRDQARLFEVFTRLHLRKQYDGTGLGLALCKRVVALHGGEIWIESSPGLGTTVHVALPAENTVRPGEK